MWSPALATAVASTLALVVSSSALCEEIRCAFLMETQDGGESFSASCSPTPEVFSGNVSAFCDIDTNHMTIQIQDVRVDLEDETISWTETHSLSPSARSSAITRYIRDGMSEEEARNRASRAFEYSRRFEIYGFSRMPSRSRVDPVTGERLGEEGVEFEITTVSFGNGHSAYQIVFSDLNDNAVLIDPVFSGHRSWTNLRYGRCGGG